MYQSNDGFERTEKPSSPHKPVVITADSTVDLTAELLERFQIKTIPLMIILGNER